MNSVAILALSSASVAAIVSMGGVENDVVVTDFQVVTGQASSRATAYPQFGMRD